MDVRPKLSKANEQRLSGQEFIVLVNAILEKDAKVRFRALGNSMKPFVKNGDLVTLKALSNRLPGLGDVIACPHPETKKLVVHRVIRLADGGCVVKGDGNRHTDGFVSTEEILGILSRIERNGRVAGFGLGWERRFIALLSRNSWWRRLLLPAWKVIRPIFRRS